MCLSTRKLRTCSIELSPDSDIIEITYEKNVVINLEEAKQILAVVEEVNPNFPEPCPRLVLHNRTVSFEFEAIRLLSSSNTINGMAVVHTDRDALPILNTLLGVFQALRVKYPIKFFNDKDAALVWLRQYEGA